MNTLAPTNGVATSDEAAESLSDKLERLERMVLDAVLSNDGATCDQVEELTGLSHQTASARLWSLERDSRVQKTAERRKTRSGRSAFVYRAA